MLDGRIRVKQIREEHRNVEFSITRHQTVGVMLRGAITYRNRSRLVFVRDNPWRYVNEAVKPPNLPFLRKLERSNVMCEHLVYLRKKGFSLGLENMLVYVLFLY